LKLEHRDLLRFAVLQKREVFFLEIIEGLAVPGANEDIHHHEPCGGLKRGGLRLLPGQAERQEECCGEPVHAESPGQNL
jgi:hypothetical protein